MISLATKYTFIIFCSTYSIICLTNNRKAIPFPYYLLHLFFLILQISLVIYVRQYSMIVCMLAMVLSSVFIEKVFLSLDMGTAITFTILGYAISYMFYAGGVLCLIVIKLVTGDHSSQVSPLIYLTIGMFQTILLFFVFQTKRLHHGLPFFQDSKDSDLGVYLSILLLLIASIFGIQTEYDRTTGILFCLLLSFGALLWYWVKTYFSREYLRQTHKREQDKLQTALYEAQKESQRLRAENEAFSKIIHKDNKLIPAMELAVCQFLCSVAQDEKQLDKADQAQKILQQLRSLSNERKGIVKNYEDTYQKLPTLGLMGLDALFLLMMQKANMSGITFHLRLSNNANRLLPKNISESDASTLLADLIENALIATSHSQREKAVEVYLCTENNILQICVSDSGSPFPPEVLKKWGIEPFTTHADTGGSGIGMMCIYELCQKYSASFKIEQLQDPSPYCKCVSIRFDGKKTFEAC